MLSEFKEHLKFLEGCCLEHPGDFAVDRVSEVIAFVPAPNDESGAALFKTLDGLYGVLNEWQDYTGHG